MKLYLMRHGIAEEPSDFPGRPDGERRLTPEGIEKTRLLAAALRRLGVRFETLLTSPMVRARETADIVAGAFDGNWEPKVVPALAANIRHGPMLEGLSTALEGVDSAFVVGHEPGLGQLTSIFLTGGTNLTSDFKKAGVCLISFHGQAKPNEGVLEWFVPPKVLCKIG